MSTFESKEQNTSLVEQLHTAIARKNLNHVKTLIEKEGADIFAFNYDRNALHNSCVYGDTSIIEYLIQRGYSKNIDCRTTDFLGSTPLMIAAESGHLEAVQLLLNWNADKSLVTHYGRKTAADVARERKHLDIYTLLSNGSIKENITNNSIKAIETRSEVNEQKERLMDEIEELKKRVAQLENQYKDLTHLLMQLPANNIRQKIEPVSSSNKHSISYLINELKQKIEQEYGKQSSMTLNSTDVAKLQNELQDLIITIARISQNMNQLY
jgi:ankyrin repeat protein